MPQTQPFDRTWDLPEALALACVLEAAAPKLGNVHPSASYADMHFGHFATAAIAFSSHLRSLPFADTQQVGDLTLQLSRIMQSHVQRNSSLGTILLFSPICCAFQRLSLQNTVPPTGTNLRQEIRAVLAGLTPKDSDLTYQVIRNSNMNGLGHQEQYDVREPAPDNLLEAMAVVEDFDAVARQYTMDYEDIFDRLLPEFDCLLATFSDPCDAICRLQLHWLAQEADGFILRKSNRSVAELVCTKARCLLEAIEDLAAKSDAKATASIFTLPAYREFDRYLREHKPPLNPGTTADLLAATLLIRLLCSEA